MSFLGERTINQTAEIFPIVPFPCKPTQKPVFFVNPKRGVVKAWGIQTAENQNMVGTRIPIKKRANVHFSSNLFDVVVQLVLNVLHDIHFFFFV